MSANKEQYIQSINPEESVYFLMHKSSLIDWHQWGSEAMEKAKDEDKLLFIHIGYVACQWCVSKTSLNFEYNKNVADFINENFVPILVDKDERPDLDRYYSGIIQEVDQLSNWPIICFTLNDGTPVFGTTYLTPDHLLEVAKNVLQTFIDDPLDVLEVAKDVSESLSPANISPKAADCSFTEKDIHIIVEPWKRKFDKKNGGTLYPPKYPLVTGKEFLLEYAYHYNDKDVLDHIKLSLDNMATGAILDHLNGAFFHYTKDAAWRYPIFEKQLIDNAVSVSLYAKAQQYMPSALYKKFIEETLQFIMRHLLAVDGGFHTSIQADILGREELLYTWTVDEFNELLGDDAKLAISYYGLKRYGKESYRNALYINSTIPQLSKEFGLREEVVEEKLAAVKATLIQAFNKRTFIAPDDKVIASANAMAANAYISGYRVLGYEEYLLFAGETLSYIKSHLMSPEGKLCHFIRNGKAEGDGFLDDYAHTIDAFINMYLIDGEEQWIFEAKRLADYAITHFFDPDLKMFLYCERIEMYSKVQTMPVVDLAFPSAGSVMLHCLAALQLFFVEESYDAMVRQMMCNIKDQLPGSGPYCANWARLLFSLVKPHRLIVLTGPKAEEVATQYFSYFYTNINIAFLKKQSSLPLFKDIPSDTEQTTYHLFEWGKYVESGTDLNTISNLLQMR